MKKQKKSRLQLNGKVLALGIIVLIIIFLVIFAGFKSVKAYRNPIQRKLIGDWNIEIENSYWVRYKDYDISTIINVKSKTEIELPAVFGEDNTFDEMEQDCTGIWEIISHNPDSVFFNVPKNPLHGKYAIRFFIDKNGWVYANMKNNIYKMYLQNDSTWLICNKGGMIFTKDLKNWEK